MTELSTEVAQEVARWGWFFPRAGATLGGVQGRS